MTRKKQPPKDKALVTPDVRLQGIRSQLLPCKLTDEELLQKGQQLAQCQQNIETEERHQDSLKKELKANLAVLEAIRAQLTSQVARKEEMRLVDVQTVLNFDTGKYQEIRCDTSETIHERPLNEDERQEALPLGEGKRHDKSKIDKGAEPTFPAQADA